MESWMLGPPVLVGERVIYPLNGGFLPGTIKWLGRLKDTFGNQMVAGIALDEPLERGCDGWHKDRRLFQCAKSHGIFTTLNRVVKLDDFVFANPGLAPPGYVDTSGRSRRSSLTASNWSVSQTAQYNFFATIRDSCTEPGMEARRRSSGYRTDTDCDERRGNSTEEEGHGSSWSISRPFRPGLGSTTTEHLRREQPIMVQLEEAIAKGNHKDAARLAKELSKKQISAKLLEQERHEQQPLRERVMMPERQEPDLSLDLFIEDEASIKGPFSVLVNPSITLAELKRQVESQLKVPAQLQRWILDKSLATDGEAQLTSYGIHRSHQPIFLYIIAKDGSSPEEDSAKKGHTAAQTEGSENSSEKILSAPGVEDELKHRKGRYWNYETNRWSFCSDDEEDQVQVKDRDSKTEAGKAAAGHQDKENEENEDYEWEYYYEDAEAAPGWTCSKCSVNNDADKARCSSCASARPTLKASAATATTAGASGTPDPKAQLDNYKKLDDLDLIPNVERFECVICFLEIEPGDGVVLRECLHTFCRECLAGAIEHSDSPQVGCPYKDNQYSCDMTILEREIRALVPAAVYEKLQQKSLNEAQAAAAQNTFHCKTPDCNGWCFVTDNLNNFKCPVCKRLNCITCQAIHEGQDCKQYQNAALLDAQDENSIKTKQWIEGLITTGEALQCPSCQVILLKKWGCDWVRCSYCRTEICWVTRQLRWGPNGKGDTSGGCRCMADGRTKCHPMCNYCH